MSELFANAGFFSPQLSFSCQSFLRVSYAVLMLGTLVMTIPHWRRFFLTEKYGGYAEHSRVTAFIQIPLVSHLILIMWLCACFMLAANWNSLIASFVNLTFCRYFFVQMRWRGILRGMGAPGFMSYWTGLAVFLFELCDAFAPACRELALLAMQIDFALIMLSAGIYKLSAGYAQSEGMDYGMVNPQWGYWWNYFKELPPKSILFKLLNHMAWFTEILAAVLMFIPQTRFLGGLLILFSFVFISTQIRLGVLCEMVIVCCVLFFHTGSYGDQLISSFVKAPELAFDVGQNSAVVPLLSCVLCGYLILLPLIHAGLFYNFYAKKALPEPLQWFLEKYSNFFGLIIWRVFSVDHINFFIKIYRSERKSGQRTLISNYGLRYGLRFANVAESIVVTTLFTTLKYYAGNKDLFEQRLLRYAKTLACPSDSILEFEYFAISKSESRYEYTPVAVFQVDLQNGSVNQVCINKEFSVSKMHHSSPAHEGERPGSYVPLRS